MRETASRGFWVAPNAPYGYRKAYVQDGGKKRPRLELDPPADAVVRRIFEMALQGGSLLDITRTLNDEGIASPKGEPWLKTTVHTMLCNEVYAGALVWGAGAKDNAPPVRVEKAFPAVVSKPKFRQVAGLLRSRAPKSVHPRRASTPYLLSGLVKCETCGKALTAHEAKGGQYTYYVCHSLLKKGRGTCDAPAQLQALRGADSRQHLGEHTHREQHPGPGEAGGRGDGRGGPGAAREASDHRGGA